MGREGFQGFCMKHIRLLVWGAALAVALMPLAAFAEQPTPQHLQDELANGQAQFGLAQDDAQALQAQADRAAANDRMIALLRSEAMRQNELNLVANGRAMEEIANALANAARAQGDANARNELMIAQNKAAVLIAIADANLANGIQLALTKGRTDEEANARAQSNFLHQVANFISGQQAELNMANARQIGQDEADAIHTPAIVQEQNSEAMGAADLLEADVQLQAGELGAVSDEISIGAIASGELAHAESSLHNDEVRLTTLP
jgi:hypothetical protein